MAKNIRQRSAAVDRAEVDPADVEEPRRLPEEMAPLKYAIYRTGRPQCVVGRAARIHESRMCHIVRGRRVATEDEQARLIQVFRAWGVPDASRALFVPITALAAAAATGTDGAALAEGLVAARRPGRRIAGASRRPRRRTAS